MLRDNILVFPSERHVQRLTSAINVDLGLTESTKAYLRARFGKLSEKDKIVALLMDEVHAQKGAQYKNGKFYGVAILQITRSLLCVMIKSICGRFRDVICMTPISNINAEKIQKVWESCVQAMTQIGFILLGKIQSDDLEGRFRWYWLLCGANYLNYVI